MYYTGTIGTKNCGFLQIRDINELSRQEVDEVINMCVREDYVSSSDNIQKRYSLDFLHWFPNIFSCFYLNVLIDPNTPPPQKKNTCLLLLGLFLDHLLLFDVLIEFFPPRHVFTLILVISWSFAVILSICWE